jgi:hypothetical protein
MVFLLSGNSPKASTLRQQQGCSESICTLIDFVCGGLSTFCDPVRSGLETAEKSPHLLLHQTRDEEK